MLATIRTANGISICALASDLPFQLHHIESNKILVMTPAGPFLIEFDGAVKLDDCYADSEQEANSETKQMTSGK